MLITICRATRRTTLCKCCGFRLQSSDAVDISAGALDPTHTTRFVREPLKRWGRGRGSWLGEGKGGGLRCKQKKWRNKSNREWKMEKTEAKGRASVTS